MSDNQLLIYIVFIIFYIVSRALRKKKPVDPSDSLPPDKPLGKPLTFEELLREFQQQNQPEPKVETTTRKQEPVYTDYQNAEPNYREAEIKEESKVLKQTFADDESRRVYEQSIKMAEGFDLKFEQDHKYKNTKSHERIFNTPKEVITYGATFRQWLNTPDSLKKAFIASEIFNRKFD